MGSICRAKRRRQEPGPTFAGPQSDLSGRVPEGHLLGVEMEIRSNSGGVIIKGTLKEITSYFKGLLETYGKEEKFKVVMEKENAKQNPASSEKSS